MKTSGKALREQIERSMKEQGGGESPQAPVFGAELVARVLTYLAEEQQRGRTLAEVAEELGVDKGRLLYWRYQRSRRKLMAEPPLPPPMRPVQVSAEMMRVEGGERERRYTLRSPVGWELRELTQDELVALLRGLV